MGKDFIPLNFFIKSEYLTISEDNKITLPSPPSPLFPPHPWWQHGEVEKDGTVFLIERQCMQLGDGIQWGEGLIDSNSQTGWAVG